MQGFNKYLEPIGNQIFPRYFSVQKFSSASCANSKPMPIMKNSSISFYEKRRKLVWKTFLLSALRSIHFKFITFENCIATCFADGRGGGAKNLMNLSKLRIQKIFFAVFFIQKVFSMHFIFLEKISVRADKVHNTPAFCFYFFTSFEHMLLLCDLTKL